MLGIDYGYSWEGLSKTVTKGDKVEGVDNLKALLGGVVSIVNSGDVLTKIDMKVCLKELLDLDESEVMELVGQVEGLDLTDDELEHKVEAVVGEGAKYAVYVLRILRLLLPKK